MFTKFTSLVMSLLIVIGLGGLKSNKEAVNISGKEKCSSAEYNYSSLAANYLEILSNEYEDRGDLPFSKRGACARWIVSELEKAGYDKSQIKTQPVFAGPVYAGKNIILTVKGKSDEKQIIVGAHYDGKGAGDNGSGVALLLANAVGLQKYQLPYTVKYVFFDCEEIGLFGAKSFARSMKKDEVNKTLFMINIDSVGFGDYCNIYGGVTEKDGKTVTGTSAYKLAMGKAKALGYNVWNTDRLNGYYKKYGKGPALDSKGVYTNPWTSENPAPENMSAVSPSTLSGVSDHTPFSDLGIDYIYFEATNWYAKGESIDSRSYTGYYETTDTTIGAGGMFMNTKYDTLKNLETYFPGRIIEHFNIYSSILSALLLSPTK